MGNFISMLNPSMTNGVFYYIVSAVLVILVMVGINMMSKVSSSVKGNLLGAGAMLAAIALTLWNFKIFNVIELYIAMLIGSLIGVVIARKTKMIQMPQMVALLNGFGGMASMIAGILTLILHDDNNVFANVTSGLAIFVGGLTFLGSIIAAGKLQRLISQKPVVYKGHAVFTSICLVVSVVSTIMFAFPPFNVPGIPQTILIIVDILASNLFGYFFAIRVGGADMPITISLLNSCSGVAGAIAGLAISDLLLVAIGAIVGASGLLLTQIMCNAMHRKLFDILLGKTSAAGVKKEPKQEKSTDTPVEEKKEEKSSDPAAIAADFINEAKNVIIVPGYGMALSQAQPLVKQLTQELEQEGKNVEFAIHPVAGRMPGHMNVLLAEVDVPYEKLHEMDEIDDKFKDTDLAIVIGANDVINPAANTAEGTPIYGMPVLSVNEAKHIIIMNFDLQPGYAGVDNPLYEEAKNSNDHVVLMLGDAKESLSSLKEARSDSSKSKSSDAPGAEKGSDEYVLNSWFADAKNVIIVPGYGMALSQAQPLVKQLTQELEQEGKNVEFAIHPVAGRMPGHMNVLLAEVDVPYEKLHEMDEIDDKFKETDLAIVIGANDVINPAANTAEGTPIYGMPVLSVNEAKHVLILNFDLQPGYAGVDNPLYEEAQNSNDHVILMLGDAKESLSSLKDIRSASVEESAPADENAGSDEDVLRSWFTDAKNIIIVPGYGMALSQAQPLVKQLTQEFEQKGKDVEFAIHPVAGRMPGHMNVLLAEVDVPYEKLHEMDEIDDKFKDTDLAIVIGANDVINPAANTAEGTPIYGMPVLSVNEAKHVLILNFDLQPGYAGVDNPLYEEAQSSNDHVILSLGDAKENIQKLLKLL